jgi:hypothetical protein
VLAPVQFLLALAAGTSVLPGCSLLLELGISVWLKGFEQYRNGDKHKKNYVLLQVEK